MTIEEAIEKEKSIAKSNHELANSYHTDFNVYMRQEGACRERAEYHEQVAEWLEELQRLKEQEPCEDCISRAKTCDYIAEFINHEYSTQSECEMVDAMIEGMHHLPSVQPKPKTGHWVEVIDEIDNFGSKTRHHECSICGNTVSGWGTYKYCPNCGSYNGGE